MNCPNCGWPVEAPISGCLLHDLVQVVRERGNTSEENLREFHAKCNTDALWLDLGKVVDGIENGEYST